jgi:hypothetical protein
MSGPTPLSDIVDIEAIDDLIESLQHFGSAQDYLQPEPARPQVSRVDFAEWRNRRLRVDYTDIRSQTRDRELDQPAVPGYRDWPADIAVDYRASSCPPLSGRLRRMLAMFGKRPRRPQ